MTKINPDPAKHSAHEVPLADRIVTGAIKEWMATAFAIAESGNPYLGEQGMGFAQALQQVRYLHLSGFEYSVVPKILKELKLAGLLVEREE